MRLTVLCETASQTTMCVSGVPPANAFRRRMISEKPNRTDKSRHHPRLLLASLDHLIEPRSPLRAVLTGLLNSR